MEFIAQDISIRQAQLLARLAAERSRLLLMLEGLDESALTSEPISGEWTATTLLTHLAYWEAFAAGRLSKSTGERENKTRPPGMGTIASRNAALRSQFAGLPFTEAVAMLQKERRGFLLALGQRSDGDLERERDSRSGQVLMSRKWATWPHRHDSEHAAEIVHWRQSQSPLDPSLRVIHRALLRPLLGLSQQEFLTLAALLPADERETRPLDGEWTLKQIIGHLVDYERLGVVALKAIAAEREPAYDELIPDFDAFNNSRGPIWAEMLWNEVWAHYRATRRALLLITETLPDAALVRPFVAPWAEMTTACGFLLDMAQHQREHADALRQTFELPRNSQL